MKRLFLLGLLSSLTACVSGESQHTFQQRLLPQFQDVSRIAIVLDGPLEPELKTALNERLKACPLYTSVRILERPLPLGSTGVDEAVAAYFNRYAKNYDALLRLRLEHREQTESTEKTQSFLLYDQDSYEWYPSYGVPRLGTMGFATGMEIAPNVSTRRRKTQVRMEQERRVFRTSLYTKAAGKLILDRVSKSQSVLANFSKEPGFTSEEFKRLSQESLLQDLLFYSCPPEQETKRTLYSGKNPGVADGYEKANADDWDGAAEAWNQVIAQDAKNTLAHHNLGVYFERQGNITEALKHYRLGYRDSRIREDAFGDIVGRFIPLQEVMEAQIAQVTGGNWIMVDVPAGEQRTMASVYRVTPLIDPDSLRIMGQTIREIAKLRFVNSQETRRAARVREHLIDSPVRVGDLVRFQDPPKAKEP